MGNPYTNSFYDKRQGGSRRSAEHIVPLILNLVEPKCVVDVGCGVGTWLAVFQENGVTDLMGIDGDYVNRDRLQIPRDRFLPADLTRPLSIDREFDLAMSVEVAEHLHPEKAEQFVDSLTRLAPVILFSAAIPYQRGNHHVNEQWPDYWAEFFEKKGYVAIDCVRKAIWSEESVEWYYAQNILLFVRQTQLEQYPALSREHKNTARSQLSLVHPRKYLEEIASMQHLVRIVQDLASVIPVENTFILVDEDMFRCELPGWQRVLPFLEKGGLYWGTPIDGPTAVAELERLRQSGASFIAFAQPCFWWLDHYLELERQLSQRFQCALKNDRVVIFDLRRDRESP